MKKSDLKDGMIVEYRNGNRRMVLRDELLGVEIYNGLEYYYEDLTNKSNEMLDIVEVFEFERGSLKSVLSSKNLKSIWKRRNTNWSEVPFGARVRCWDGEAMEKLEGLFLEYIPYDDFGYKFRVYTGEYNPIEYEYCELI